MRKGSAALALYVVTVILLLGVLRMGRAHEEERGERPDSPGEAAEFRRLQLADENGEIPDGALMRARAHMDAMREASQDANLIPSDWTWLGPGTSGGRVRTIVVHPTTPSTWFAGSVSGGIWKTTDSGGSWAPLDDFMANLAVSSLVMKPGDPNTMYAGTGEGFGITDGSSLGSFVRGAGVFKSTDGGVSWNRLAPTASPLFYQVTRLAMSPAGTTLLAATTNGVYRTTDGGVTFTGSQLGYVTDVNFNPADSTRAVASGNAGDAWYSINGGATWTAAGGLPGQGRVEVAYAPSAPSIVYASVEVNGGSLYKSVNGGASYSLVFSGAPDYLGTQGWYDNALWVDPTNPSFLIVGGIDLWKSSDGGVSWTQISRWDRAPVSAHADQHVIVEMPGFNGSTNTAVLFGNDGGVYSTSNVYTVGSNAPDYTSGWAEKNNTLGITQYYGAAGNVTTGTIVGGTQDNGTLVYTPAGGTEGHTTMFGGDGGFCAADPTSSSIFYGEYVRLTIFRSTNAGQSASYIYGGLADAGVNANFIAPFILDPNDANRLLAGGAQLWRSNNVKAATPTWASIKPATTSMISAIAVAPGNADVCWVGHNNGDVYRTANCTAVTPTWTRVDLNTPGLPNRFVLRITLESAVRAYVSFGGFSPDNLWRTTDAGASWTDVTGSGATGLPDVPVRDLEVHPFNSALLYAATETGVFTSQDTGATWQTPQRGPANVSVDELFWMNSTLVAATHGRGLYKTAALQGSDATLTVSASTAAPGAAITATVANSPGGATDWLALARTDDSSASYLQYTYVGAGVTTRTWTVNMPTTLGTYEFRLFANNGYTRLATSPTVTVAPPIGTITSISPSAVAEGSGAFTLTVNGSGFSSYSLVQIAGQAHIPTTVSPTQLTVAVAAGEVAFPSSKTVIVTHGAPGSPTSNAVTLTVVPTPGLTPNPTAVVAGGAATVTLTGSAGAPGDWLAFARTDDPLTTYQQFEYVGTGVTTRTWTVNTPLTPGLYEFRLFALNGFNRISRSLPVSVMSAAPTIASITPANVAVGAAAFPLTVTGTGFNTASEVRIGGVARTTAFASGTQLTASVLASDVAALGTRTVVVVNPSPGGGTSNSKTLTIAPPPAIAVNAAAVAPGSPITATLTNSPGGATDWLAIARTSDVNTTYVQYVYVGAGTTTRTWTINAPTAPGTYEFRLFANNTFSRLATSPSFTVNNPVPAITSLSPAAIAAGSAGFTLTVNGTNFLSTSVVQINGAARTTAFVSGTQLTAAVLATDVTTTGTRAVTVVTPAPGGGTSNSATLTVAPPPALAVNATTVAAGSPLTATLTNGTGGATDWLAFARTSDPNTSYQQFVYVGTGVATRTWTINMPAATGTYEIRLFANNGFTRLATSPTVTVVNPVPAIASLSPAAIAAGSAGFTLTVNGSNFTAGSVVQINSVARTTVMVSSSRLTASLPASDVATTGTKSITVMTPAPGGGTSNPATLTVTPPPALAVNATSVALGGAVTATLTNGAGGALDWLALARTTDPDTTYLQFTYVGSGVTTRTWPVSMPSTAGTYEFRLFANNGFTRLATSPTVTVNNPVPAIASISPATLAAGGADFTLTVNGSGFTASSVVRINGVARTTALVSSSRLTAIVPAADVATAGTRAVTVFTSTPGGGTSNTATLTLTPPPALAVSATTVTAGGAVTMTLTNGAGGSADWLALARTTDPNTTYAQFTYVGTGVTSRTWTIPMPATAGSYEFRLFANNGYTRLATSPAITVTSPPPAIAVTATGSTITATLTNSPGGTGDWLALARPADPTTTYLQWTYVGAGVTSRTWTVTAAAGTYEIRLYGSAGFLTKSAPITVPGSVPPPTP